MFLSKSSLTAAHRGVSLTLRFVRPNCGGIKALLFDSVKVDKKCRSVFLVGAIEIPSSFQAVTCVVQVNPGKW